MDTSEVASANAAADELVERGARVDFLLLNAGASSKDPSFNSDGVEITYASTLVGHHALTMRALADGLLATHWTRCASSFAIRAARRYLDAADFSDDETGHFYATAHRKKLVGPMGIQIWPDYFTDERGQEAAFDAMVKLTGVGFPQSDHR